jgi:hypothetical protein
MKKTIKKLICNIAIGSMLLFLQTVNAQINLEHTFDGTVTWTGGSHVEQDLYPANSYYYTGVSANSYVVKIYNADYSIRSNNTYNFTPPAGYKVSAVSMSRKVFNTDDNYEFLVTYQKTDNLYNNTNEKIILHNQNGSTIKDFGFAYSLYAYPYFHIANNHYRLIVVKTYFDGSNFTQQAEIYSAPGTPPTGVSNIRASEVQSPYPNPANSTITLPYQLKQGEMSVMQIFNINGQLIETKQIDYIFDKILLNVSEYTKGVYIYVVNGVSNRFIVN